MELEFNQTYLAMFISLPYCQKGFFKMWQLGNSILFNIKQCLTDEGLKLKTSAF